MFFVQQICYLWAILYKFNPENINLDEKKCGDIIKENLYLVNLWSVSTVTEKKKLKLELQKVQV